MPPTKSPVEVWFRRLLMAFSVLAGVGILSQFGVMTWAWNELSPAESVVAVHSATLARNGTLYPSLKDYPYTVSAYTPIFYWLEASLSRTGITTVAAGRMVSFSALLGVIFLVWKLVWLKTGDSYCAWMAALLAGSSALLLSWGTTGHVDMLAAFWSLLAFYFYSRDEKSLLLAGLAAALAFFTKQTAIACPAAIFTLLLFQSPRRALRFGGLLAGSVMGLIVVINFALDGRFLDNILFANLNPFATGKLIQQLRHFLVTAGPLLLIASAGRKIGPAFAYLGFAAAVFLATAPKIGSDLNYQIEITILLIVTARLSLNSLTFFPLSFASSKRWVTLLQIPLGVFLAVNLRLTINTVLARIATERMLRQEIAQVRPWVDAGGHLLSVDFNVMARLRGEIEVEPLIYTLLVRAGRIDPEPLRRDLAARRFATVLLLRDVNSAGEEMNPELSTFTKAQLREIQQNYQLVSPLPSSPHGDAVYVYRVRKAGGAEAQRLAPRAAW